MVLTTFINEIHYDNDGTDIGEFIEIAGLSGTNLTGWRIILYNGANGLVYDTTNLSGSIPNQNNGLGTVVVNYATNGIQNGSPDGIALVDNNNNVLQFLSYEGSFTAIDGVAAGLTSTNIGVQESSSTPIGFSLQLTGDGTVYSDFTWTGPIANTSGAINTGQSFGGVVNPATPVINEFVFDHTGSDIFEYVEIFGNANTDYSNFSLLQIEGDSNSPGTIDSVYTLGTTNSNGFWTTGFLSNVFENGTVTLLLVENFTGNIGFDLDTNNDGTLDLTPWGNLVDSVAVSDGGTGDLIYTNVVLTPGFDGVSFKVGGASRIPNGQDTDTVNDWTRNDFDGEGIAGLPGSPQEGEALNTPGATNELVEITPPPPEIIPIYQIQGAGHTSSFVGQSVTTQGIVTAMASNGFYLQSPTDDGNIATSEGIFVFAGSNFSPSFAVGDSLQVQGTVSEFLPGNNSQNLSITQLVNPTITPLANSLGQISPTIIGNGGRIPPTSIIEDDNFTSFDPLNDGIDFYESLEGMLVQVNDTLVVAPTNNFGEIWLVGDNGTNATGINNREGITISEDDFNPERIQIDDGLFAGGSPTVNVGDSLGNVTGVVSYNFGNYEVLPTVAPTVQGGTLVKETTILTPTTDQLTVASYNVENLDPNDNDGDTDIADGRFTAIAEQIVNNLKTPDIIALQEVQDNDGSVNSNIVDASLTYQTLIDAIVDAGGPRYEFADIPPIDDQSGGQPGANIRVGYLYNPNRVDLIEESLTRIEDPNLADGNAFENSRNPLAATFVFNEQEVTLVNNHFASKGGSSPLFGSVQPPINGSVDQRIEQAQVVNNFVSNILGSNPDANAIVLGDLNEFQFFSPLEILQQTLNNLTFSLPENERYSYIFEGNSQQLDHILVSDNLLNSAEFDIVHINSQFADQTSDHDPLLARFNLAPIFNEITGTFRRDILNGTDGNDRILGLGGADRIAAGKGNDMIIGGNGVDVLSGGEGNNIFVYETLGDGFDFIVDFNPSKDRIDFSQILANPNYGSSTPFEDYIFLSSSGGNTMVEIDPNGDIVSSSQKLMVVLQGVNLGNLSPNNFIL
ncbi:Endonuclease/exonuclease/phosphatase [Gloeothece citriformis PCC 7424]|uniref:Endonuclease/exonuclease/phosphatase n=1 Tax=Gloeothece citriformis (strain PCC 7424) TaxID=65393 RepID=B7KC42_GLOC7|nr:endonuclease/exonuclease/phosphatase family protein [Gloeothece citriformis]ACK68865.1 Endonuclease/exonuclease/phosphatase [Gloeothece citriformis PCC 7424]